MRFIINNITDQPNAMPALWRIFWQGRGNSSIGRREERQQSEEKRPPRLMRRRRPRCGRRPARAERIERKSPADGPTIRPHVSDGRWTGRRIARVKGRTMRMDAHVSPVRLPGGPVGRAGCCWSSAARQSQPAPTTTYLPQQWFPSDVSVPRPCPTRECLVPAIRSYFKVSPSPRPFLIMMTSFTRIIMSVALAQALARKQLPAQPGADRAGAVHDRRDHWPTWTRGERERWALQKGNEQKTGAGPRSRRCATSDPPIDKAGNHEMSCSSRHGRQAHAPDLGRRGTTTLIPAFMAQRLQDTSSSASKSTCVPDHRMVIRPCCSAWA